MRVPEDDEKGTLKFSPSNGNEKLHEMEENIETHKKQIEQLIRNGQHHNARVTKLLRLQDQLSKLKFKMHNK